MGGGDGRHDRKAKPDAVVRPRTLGADAPERLGQFADLPLVEEPAAGLDDQPC